MPAPSSPCVRLCEPSEIDIAATETLEGAAGVAKLPTWLGSLRASQARTASRCCSISLPSVSRTKGGDVARIGDAVTTTRRGFDGIGELGRRSKALPRISLETLANRCRELPDSGAVPRARDLESAR